MSFPAPLIVSESQRADARRARVTVLVIVAACLALAVFALVAFPPGDGTRGSLTVVSILLAGLGVLAALRLLLIRRKADRLLTPSGNIIAMSARGVVASGDVLIPWQAISGVWAHDRGASFRAQGRRRGPFGALSRLMARAGTSTIDLTIGISDTTRIDDPHSLVTRHREQRGRLEIPFGSWHGPDELARVMQGFANGLQGAAPVRYCSGPMDYGAVWAGTADGPDAIAKRESEAAKGQ